MQRKHHVHKYRRVNLGRDKEYYVFACARPDCSHYIPEAIAIGRKCLCWRCGEEFVLDQKAASLAKPHCEDCTHRLEEGPRPEFTEVEGSIFADLIPRVPKISSGPTE